MDNEGKRLGWIGGPKRSINPPPDLVFGFAPTSLLYLNVGIGFKKVELQLDSGIKVDSPDWRYLPFVMRKFPLVAYVFLLLRCFGAIIDCVAGEVWVRMWKLSVVDNDGGGGDWRRLWCDPNI